MSHVSITYGYDRIRSLTRGVTHEPTHESRHTLLSLLTCVPREATHKQKNPPRNRRHIPMPPKTALTRASVSIIQHTRRGAFRPRTAHEHNTMNHRTCDSRVAPDSLPRRCVSILYWRLGLYITLLIHMPHTRDMGTNVR